MLAEMFIKIARRLNYPNSRIREILEKNGIYDGDYYETPEQATDKEMERYYIQDEGKEFNEWL